MNKRVIGILLFVATICTACDDLFEYSPFSAKVDKEYKNTNLLNLGDLLSQKNLRAKDSINIAFISDTHQFYKDLGDFVDNINQRSDIDFVIHCGDLTDEGKLEEFKNFHQIIDGLNSPYFTVIGNHDYRSNGEKIYRQMYGNTNYSFEYNAIKFVFFDNIIWESNKQPDLKWLEDEIETKNDNHQVVCISHLPLNSIEVSDSLRFNTLNILEDNAILALFNGHTHSFEIKDDINFQNFVISAINRRSYFIFTIKNTESNLTKVEF